MELTFSRFMRIIIDKIWLLLLLIVVFCLSSYIISSFVIKPQYQSSTTFMINKKIETSGNTDISGEKAIQDKYIAYTEAEVFLKEISTNLKNEKGMDISAQALKNCITITDDSTKYMVTVTALSANDAFVICDTIANLAPSLYKTSDLITGSEVKVVDTPKLNPNQVSPNTLLNTVLGAILGALAGIFLIIMIDMIDNSIKDESDLIDNYEVPLLGVIYTHRVAEVKEGNTK